MSERVAGSFAHKMGSHRLLQSVLLLRELTL
jgi:hypothetical protein